MTYFILPSACTRIINSLTCIDVDPAKESGDINAKYGSTLRLQSDYSIDCKSADFAAKRAFAIAMLIVYFFFVPISYLFLLYEYRDMIKARNDASSNEETRTRRESMATDSKNFLSAIGNILSLKHIISINGENA